MVKPSKAGLRDGTERIKEAKAGQRAGASGTAAGRKAAGRGGIDWRKAAAAVATLSGRVAN